MQYEFGRFTLCPDSFTLTRDNAPVHVEPQVFDLLHLLVSRAGQLVSHDDLIAVVWGGRIVSDATVSARISAARAVIGDSGARQEWLRTVPRRGFRFLGEVRKVAGKPEGVERETPQDDRQRIGFCRSRDGTRIAYARSGEGPVTLVRAGHWLTHLEHDWHSPVWRPVLATLGRDFTLLRYDQRGNGLSAREVEDLSLDAQTDDLAAVVDAAGAGRFVLYGTSQGAAVAIRYALRHPDRVSHLILHGGFSRGRRRRGAPEEAAMSQALVTLIRDGWGRPGSAFLRAFAALFIPDGDSARIRAFGELQRITTSVEMAVRLREAADDFDVSASLCGIGVPTLVMHARDDAVHPLEEGLALAEGIPGAEFVMLESANHVLVENEPAWSVCFEAMRRFVAGPARA